MRVLLALFMIMFALGAWGGYGGFIWLLGEERTLYISALEDAERESLRGESATRTHAVVAGTEAERQALENLTSISVLQTVEAIEGAGDAAGVSEIEIGAATPASAPQGLSAVSITANASGSFASLARAVRLLETLPIPAALERLELSKSDSGNTWSLTAHLRVVMNPSN